MKYRPPISSIEDLQEGDEFLVGEERFQVKDGWAGIDAPSDKRFRAIPCEILVYAKVPIERDIPCPEGYELRIGDGKWRVPEGAKFWHKFVCEFKDIDRSGYFSFPDQLYAILKQPQECNKVFEGEVRHCRAGVLEIYTKNGRVPAGTKVQVVVTG